jgi:flavin reductase (DIM6/NTAB) family NADH-FMN oxidoreductase RutF/predicted enzyme related to lactoylglutathione lyase
MVNFGKVEVSCNREDWSPVALPEQVVLVTTMNAEGQPHVAAKSRFTVLSYGPPTIIVFMCRNEYPTFANVEATGEFVMNVPGDDLVATTWVVGSDPGERGPTLFSDNGLTPIPSLALRPPRIAECHAHFECKVLDTKRFANETATFGEVVSASINKEIADKKEVAKKYAAMSPIFFLEAGWTSSLGCARPVENPVSGPKHDVTILAVSDLSRSISFYSKAFDWTIRTHGKHYAEFELPGGLGLALCTKDGFLKFVGATPDMPKDGVSPVQIYLRTDDLPRSIARLHAAGATPLSKASDREWGEEAAYFGDPDGHVLVVSRPVPKP